MNEQQRLYLIQARSDWKIYRLLKDEHICHQLHYLQMATEKLAKAYHWQDPGARSLGHAAFAKFVNQISTNSKVRKTLKFHSNANFQAWIQGVKGLVDAIERLAPSLASDGPNPEYPWPRAMPLFSPAEHDFHGWKMLPVRQRNDLTGMVEKILTDFESLF